MEGAEDCYRSANESEDDDRCDSVHADGRAHAELGDVHSGDQPHDAGEDDQGLFRDVQTGHRRASLSSGGVGHG